MTYRYKRTLPVDRATIRTTIDKRTKKRLQDIGAGKLNRGIEMAVKSMDEKNADLSARPLEIADFIKKNKTRYG